MRSNCHNLSLIPSPDSLCLKFRNSMPVNRGKKSLRHGKRSILIKVRSDVKFKDNMQRDALFRGIPLFGTVMGRKNALLSYDEKVNVQANMDGCNQEHSPVIHKVLKFHSSIAGPIFFEVKENFCNYSTYCTAQNQDGDKN